MKELIITRNTSIQKALQIINNYNLKTLCVVNSNKVFLGTVSEGDIRRFILKRKDFSLSIDGIYNNKAFSISEKNYSLSDLKKIFLKEKYDLIPVLKKNKKIKKLIFFDDLFKKISLKTNPIKTVIMAGGEGVRLRPYTYILPKPLMPVKNKTMVEHIIDLFNKNGFNNFIFSLNYKGKLIESYFKNIISNNKISFFYEKKKLGTAGSIKNFSEQIKESFFLVNADSLIDININKVFKFHKKNNNQITVLASAIDYQIPYGVFKTNFNGKLLRVDEKPKQNFLVNAGMYCLEPEVIKLIPNKKYDMNELIENAIKKKMKVMIYPISKNSWKDLSSLKIEN